MNQPAPRSRRALVTGGSRGIGRAIVRSLAADGCDVAFTYRTDHAAAEETVALANTSGQRVRAVALDLDPRVGPDGIEACIAETTGWLGGLDVLVANAGIWNVDDRPIESWSADDLSQFMAINLQAVMLLAGAAAPALRASGAGRFVAIGSTAGVRGEAGHAPYAAAKGALLAFVRSLTSEWAADGVTSNVVAPGWVRTDMTRDVLDEATLARVETTIPTGRVSDPEDIAAAVAFLASPSARQISGIILDVNGGAVFS